MLTGCILLKVRIFLFFVGMQYEEEEDEIPQICGKRHARL